MSGYSATDRFFRPADVKATRRNQRHLQVWRFLRLAANLLLLAVVFLSTFWVWQHLRRDSRFAIRDFTYVGAKQTSVAELDEALAPYLGRNLFDIDLAALRGGLTALPWVEAVTIEKQLPGTIVVMISEREPVALLEREGQLLYVARDGRPFAPLSAKYGSKELPLIRGESPEDVAELATFVVSLREEHPELYSRIAHVAALAGDGVEIFDRDLRMTVRLPREGAANRWLTLYRVAAAENIDRGSAAYADLRFEDRLVIKRLALKEGGGA